MSDVNSAPGAMGMPIPGEAAKPGVTPPPEADQGVTLPPEQEDGGEETAEQRKEREARHERRRQRADRQRYEAQIRENERLKFELEQSRRQPQSRGDDPDDPRPVMSEYQDMFEYQSDLAAWKVAQRGKQDQAKRAPSDRQSAEHQRVAAELNRSIEVYARSHPTIERDVQKLIDGGFRMPPGAMAALVGMGDLAPAVLQHLSRNPDEADELEGLSEAAVIRRLGRLEAKLEGTLGKQPNKVTDAPDPISPVPTRAPKRFDPEKSTMDDYAAHWKERRKKEGQA